MGNACTRRRARRAAPLFLLLVCAASVAAQSTATLRGAVVDPEGARVAGATVTLLNDRTGYRQVVESDAEGEFAIFNIPLQHYLLRIVKSGFETLEQPVALTSNIPQRVEARLRLGVLASEVTVAAFDSELLVDAAATGTRTELSSRLIERLPQPPDGRGVEAVLLSFPGFAKNANGAIHPRGAHNQMTFVVDGMPISDQLTGSFASALDLAMVEHIELFTGNVPAEFGSKISGVANIVTRSGRGSGRAFFGSFEAGGGGAGMLSHLTEFGGERGRLGWFGGFRALKSNRFLDPVSLDNLHNGGNSQRGFARVDWQAGSNDTLRFNVMAGRSSFQVANLRSQHAAGQRQRQRLGDFSVWGGWLRTLDARTTLDATAGVRTSTAALLPSPGDTPVTAAQERRQTNVFAGIRWTATRGAHSLRAGADAQVFPVRERFAFGITHPDFNDPASEGFIETLLPHDLSRGGSLFSFADAKAGRMFSFFLEDRVRLGDVTLTLGLRHDEYRFLVRARQTQPRLGIAWKLPAAGTVLRASYNRTFQTPPNENLLLASSDATAALAPASVREALGGGRLGIRPERENVFELGLQQPLGRRLALDAAYYHRDKRDIQDNDNFLNTGIIFPTSLVGARVNGAEGRITLLPWGPLSGSVSFTHFRTVVTPPFTGGLFLGSNAVDALSAGPFIIDHDQQLGIHGVARASLGRGFWLSGVVRYDSGLVSNPSDPAEVAADPDFADLLPLVDLERDPPRVRPRTIVDLAFGYEHRRGDRRLWDAQVQVANLTDKQALYNFQSIFVGTRLVPPRTVSARLRLHW